jgi:hypothetical protein
MKINHRLHQANAHKQKINSITVRQCQELEHHNQLQLLKKVIFPNKNIIINKIRMRNRKINRVMIISIIINDRDNDNGKDLINKK